MQLRQHLLEQVEQALEPVDIFYAAPFRESKIATFRPQVDGWLDRDQLPNLRIPEHGARLELVVAPDTDEAPQLEEKPKLALPEEPPVRHLAPVSERRTYGPPIWPTKSSRR